MPVQFEKWFRVDLNKKAMTEWIGNGLFTNDNLSNLIGVELYDGLTPIDMPGNVEGILILPNGGTLTINGSTEGNRAWIELPETALSLEGLIVITIKTIINDRKVTLVQCSGRVVATETGMVIDPDDIVPKDVTEFMAMLDDLRDLIDGYSDIIMVQDTQPDSETNKLWLLKTPVDGIQIPTMDDLNSVSSTVSGLVEDVTDIQSDLLDVHSDLADAIERVETLETTTEGLSDSVEGISGSVDALSDTVDDMQETLEHKADIDGYYTDMTVGAAEQVVSSTMVEDNAPYKFRTSGGSTDIGNRAYVDKIVGGTVAWNQQVRDAASENVTEYADVVTVTDAVVDDAAVSVKVEPVQDLHGQDSPWPAGGGVNKATLWKNAYVDSDGNVVATNANGMSVPLTMKNGDTITASRGAFERGGYAIFSSFDGTSLSGMISRVGTYQTASATYTATQDCYYVGWFNQTSGVVTSDIFVSSKAQIEFGSTATSYKPYENLCPISGWDEVEVTRTGKNLMGINEAYGIVSAITITDGVATGDIIAFNNRFIYIPQHLVGKRLTLSVKISVPATVTRIFARANVNGNDIDGNNVAPSTTGITTVSFTPTSTSDFFRLSYGSGSGTLTVSDFQLELGSTATAFEAYQGTQYTIEMPTEAGTVYGGELTVNKDGSGSLAVNNVIVDLGTLPWFAWVNDANTFVMNGLPNIDVNNQQMLCEVYAPLINGSTLWGAITSVDMVIYHPLNGTWVLCRNTRYDNAASFKASVQGVRLVYPITTPLTYTLTATQVRTLLGTNHVWSDAGQIALTYTGTDEHLTLTSGRKYLTRIDGTDSMVLGAAQTVTAVKGQDNVFDLTQMLGTSVADYAYQQGAGFFRKWFGGTRYAYNAGELISVQGVQSRDVTGFNQIDITEFARLYPSICSVSGDELNCISHADLFTTGVPIQFPKSIEGYCSVELKAGTATNVRLRLFFSNGTYQEFGGTNSQTYVKYGGIFNRNADLVAVRLNWTNAGTFSVRNLCINLSHNGTRNGEYEPYTHRSYPLDSTLTLRGIPKVDSNGVYWDGDEHESDGTVTRKYGEYTITGNEGWQYYAEQSYFYVVVNLGAVSHAGSDIENAKMTEYLEIGVMSKSVPDRVFTLNTTSHATNNFYIKDTRYNGDTIADFKAHIAGMKLVYKLATPTDETAAPYQQIQQVDDWGTEEFVSTSIVPVGHATRYPANLRDKLQHLPALASANGSYIITQTDGQMVLSPFPTPPTAAGNYLLKATVSGGNATYSWVAQ